MLGFPLNRGNSKEHQCILRRYRSYGIVDSFVVNRFLFLVSSMDGGGAERVAALLCNHWAGQGHQVTLMPTFSGRGGCVYPLDRRVRLEFLADRVGSRSRSIFNKLRRLFALRQAIRELSPDVILAFLPHVSVAAIIAAGGLRVPVVVSERIYPPAMPLTLVLERLRQLTYPWASTVVVQTKQAKQWLSACCPKAYGQVIANPVVYPLPGGEPRVDPDSVIGGKRKLALAVGRLDRQKGFDLLLSAFGSLAPQFSEWDLVVLGGGPERECLERQRKDLGLSDRIHLPGWVGNLYDWYTRADLFVMSSRFEGFPNTLMEAMAHGLPAVSFDCSTGPADLIEDGVNGYLVPLADGASGLAERLGDLMRFDAKRQSMGKQAALVRERYSIHRVVRAWDRVLGLVH